MSKDLWHYHRTALAKQVLGMFETGMSNALVFFAPRRMGKTEFLRKDVQPLAEKRGWRTFYFSFLDTGINAKIEFTQAIADFSENKVSAAKVRGVLSRIRKMSGAAAGVNVGIELDPKKHVKNDVKRIIASLGAHGKVLLLLDEVQMLAQSKKNDQFIAGLRTALDVNKDSVKAIFTGSSRDGLRRMFSEKTAPFFHFGQNLPFPELGKEFTDHLASIFQKATQRKLDLDVLWEVFLEMEKVPQLVRSLVERLALNPNMPIKQAKTELLADILNDRAFEQMWDNCSPLEQFVLQELANDAVAIFSEKTRNEFSKKLEIPELSVPKMQSAMRSLSRKLLIGRSPVRGQYFIDDPNFKSWIQKMANTQ
jgi:uncharacterized protein